MTAQAAKSGLHSAWVAVLRGREPSRHSLLLPTAHGLEYPHQSPPGAPRRRPFLLAPYLKAEVGGVEEGEAPCTLVRLRLGHKWALDLGRHQMTVSVRFYATEGYGPPTDFLAVREGDGWRVMDVEQRRLQAPPRAEFFGALPKWLPLRIPHRFLFAWRQRGEDMESRPIPGFLHVLAEVDGKVAESLFQVSGGQNPVATLHIASGEVSSTHPIATPLRAVGRFQWKERKKFRELETGAIEVKGHM